MKTALSIPRAVIKKRIADRRMVALLVTLPEHEIVVAVASNISHADTFGVALKIAREFAEPSQAPSRD